MEHPVLVLRPFFKTIDFVIHEYGDYLMIPFTWGALALIAFILFRRRRPKPMILEVRVQVDTPGHLKTKSIVNTRRSEPVSISHFKPLPEDLGESRSLDRN